MLDPAPIHAALRAIPDPEMPISIVDLGLIERVDIQPIEANGRAAGGDARVVIDLLPTFVGCPALDMIAGEIRAKVGALPGVVEVRVNWVFDPPWSVDRISDEGRASLKAHGVTVPARRDACCGSLRGSDQFAGLSMGIRDDGARADGHSAANPVVRLQTSAVPCPFCGSSSTYLDSPFGPTRCRSIYYCEACRNSFEHMKRIEQRSA